MYLSSKKNFSNRSLVPLNTTHKRSLSSIINNIKKKVGNENTAVIAHTCRGYPKFQKEYPGRYTIRNKKFTKANIKNLLSRTHESMGGLTGREWKIVNEYRKHKELKKKVNPLGKLIKHV